ncbi:TadE/TadG family type IV pilus assembly protein [Nocardioides xinjiangensis]|uniref:TadE/TadG family type IV pilus assembly protein n=1 Tax=Nocardioides xinjiangensis TaxID=2817376 RepID=UPI001B30187A|nr:TadE/TadG family type IV pilus assembly protein [Nocardioides sp. SYSU D00778]
MLTAVPSLRPVVDKRRRDETGTVAVMVALMAMVILGMAAVAIDVGQVYAKRASLQSAVDQAVLAAAAELDGTTVCTAGAVTAAEEYLVSNWIDQGGDPKAVADIDLAADNTLADGSKDGYMVCNKWRVDLWAPTAKVNLGLAKAVTDETNVQVPAHAAAEVRSPRLGTLPYYATPTCSTGQQVLSTDSSGHASPPVIPLTPSTTTLNSSNVTALDPSTTPVGTPISSMVVTGTNFTSPTSVTAVGFTNASGDHYQVAIDSGATITSSTRIAVSTIPFPVASEDVWYVRVLKGGNWSASNGNATSGVQKFTVGDEKLYCNLSDKGNFGSLKIDRTPSISNPNTLIYYNTALGVDHELGTAPGAPSAPSFCTAGSGFITAPVDGQNCMATDTGLPANALEEGMITGSDPTGRLRKPATSPCTRPNVTVSSYSLNDDVLSCFFTNPTIRVGDVTKSTYTGEPVISPAIFDSPRFVWVPIINEPPSGSSKNVSIQGFKPGFITDQPASGTRGGHGTTTGVPNGLTLSGTKVREVRIWFIHPNALPSSSTAEGHEVAYRGTGAKVIVLVD